MQDKNTAIFLLFVSVVTKKCALLAITKKRLLNSWISWENKKYYLIMSFGTFPSPNKAMMIPTFNSQKLNRTVYKGHIWHQSCFAGFFPDEFMKRSIFLPPWNICQWLMLWNDLLCSCHVHLFSDCLGNDHNQYSLAGAKLETMKLNLNGVVWQVRLSNFKSNLKRI